MKFRPTLKRILLNTIWELLYLILFGSLLISAFIGQSFLLVGIILLFCGLFVGIPIILHLNYWSFDKDTEFWISGQGFKLKNRATDKEFIGQTSDIEKIITVETPPSGIPWMHEYTAIKMKDGRIFRISNYVIDSVEIIEIMGLQKIVTRKEIFIPRIPAGTADNELRRLG